MPQEYSKQSEYPSVTEVLSPYSGYDQIPPWNLEKAAERGTIVHAHCAAIALGRWTPSPKDEYQGYVTSGRLWLEAYMDEPLLVEEELEDPELGYCGHPDLIIRSEKLGGVIMPDLKTPVQLHRKVWGAQLTGYENLAKKDTRFSLPEIDRLGSLRLYEDGRMAKFDDFTDNRVAYWAAFYGALIAHRFFMS
ncbi:MAG: hypothetical protein JRC93_12390 [Deltaproteobacteria bacterium]|nr:hypothetical protein [Deltaproteobacteria bacterium]